MGTTERHMPKEEWNLKGWLGARVDPDAPSFLLLSLSPSRHVLWVAPPAKQTPVLECDAPQARFPVVVAPSRDNLSRAVVAFSVHFLFVLSSLYSPFAFLSAWNLHDRVPGTRTRVAS